jgi:TolB-like protein/DNA-binding winged helix-turn-helix (wHTH) protein
MLPAALFVLTFLALPSLRRFSMDPTVTQRPPVMRFGVFEADLRSGELRKNGAKVRIQELPFRALALLLSRPNEVISREEFRGVLWPDGVFVDFDRGITSTINRLRDALGDSASNPCFIETMDRRGYRWIAPASAAEPATVQDSKPGGVGGVNLDTGVDIHKKPFLRAISTRWTIAVAAVLVLGIAAIAFFVLVLRWKTPAIRPGSVHAIAVLPLVNGSGDSRQDYLADGLADELTTDLARITSLRVVSRTSVQQYKNTSKPLPVIARELNIDAVVEGSVKKEGDLLWVNVQLVDARNDRHIWADTLQRTTGSASSIQHELAEAIGHQIGVQLTPLEEQYFSGRHPIDPASYQAYLQGRYYWNKRSPEGLAKAESYFREAIRLDPQNALAFAGLADTYVLDAFYTLMPAREASQKAQAAAAQAMALDDQLAEAHCSVAYARFFQDWDFAGAETEFRRALQLNPNFATAHQWFAEMLSVLQRHDEAISEIRRAEELDPFAPIMHHEAGQILQNARQYRQALEEYRKAEAQSDLPWPHYGAALAHRRLGEYDLALKELRAASTLNSNYLDPSAVDALDHAYEKSGARGFLSQSVIAFKLYPHPAYSRALDYASLGEKAKALQSLEEAYRNHDLDVLLLQCSPELDGLRSDPQFDNLRRRIGLP